MTKLDRLYEADAAKQPAIATKLPPGSNQSKGRPRPTTVGAQWKSASVLLDGA